MSLALTDTDAVLNRLKAGNARFCADKLEHALQDQSRRDALTGGQTPWAIVLSCADSRVAPELTFDTGLGELFVIRVAGNIANTETIASIEYAVANLGTKVIVVLGHQSCGAVTAAMKGGDLGYNLNILLAQINPAVNAMPEGKVDDVVRCNAQLVAQELAARSPIIREALDDGLVIKPAFYSLEDGSVDFL